MENTKIFIDVDDEITFISERISLANTQNVILVVPEKALLLASLAGLKLLAAMIGKYDKHVVIVTMDDVGKLLSEKAGFITKTRVGEVDASVWDNFIAPSELEIQISPPVQEAAVAVKQENEISLSLGEVKQINPSVNQIDDLLDDGEKKPDEAPTVQEKPPQKTKIVPPLKVIKLLDDFELVIGGDAAVLKKSRDVEPEIVSKKAEAITMLHEGENDENGIVGSDIEAHISKKKSSLSL